MANIKEPPFRENMLSGRGLSTAWWRWFDDLKLRYNADIPQLVEVVDIDNPVSELSSFGSSTSGSILIAASAESSTADSYTIYLWDTDTGLTASTPYIVEGDGGFWVAVAGKYSNQSARFSVLTASRLLQSDSSKGLASVADLTNWIIGTLNKTTVTDNGAGGVVLSISDNYLPSSVAGEEGIEVEDDGDGTITVKSQYYRNFLMAGM